MPENAAKVVEYTWDIHISVKKVGSVYTYQLERYFYDEELTDYCWLPLDSPRASYFESEEAALRTAREKAKQYCADHPKRDMFIHDK